MADCRMASLACLEIRQVFEFKPPLDLRIAGQSSGAGAGHVCQHAVEECSYGKLTGVRGDHLNVGRGNQLRSTRARCGCNSMATMLASGLRAARVRVFPPGAAQQSRIVEP